MRQLEPFAYFAGQASAIPGFGGGEAAPDTRYCFHTLYEPVRPGRAIYHLTLRGARASGGELTLRVHGFKPGGDAEIALAGGGRLRLGDASGETIELPIRFSAAPGGHYALYGYLSEPADLVAEAVDIAIEEVDEPAGGGSARPVSAAGLTTGYEPGNRLFGEEPPSIDHPTSQPCTLEQLVSPRFAELWPAIPASHGDLAGRWRLVMPLQLLERSGLLAAGSRGLIVDAPDAALAEALRARGCNVRATDGAVLSAELRRWTSDEPADGHDFVLAFERPAAPENGPSLPERMITQVGGGGLVVAMLAIDPREPWPACRNRLQQIALRLIGAGHDVAQLCFPRAETLARSKDGWGWFCFVARR